MGLAAVKRHKVDIGKIRTVDDLDLTIRAIGFLDMTVEKIEADLDLKIKTTRAEAVAEAAQYQAERAALFSMAQAFVSEHKEAVLKGKRAAQLNYGKCGYRRLPEKVAIPHRATPEMEELCDRIEEMQRQFKRSRFTDVTIHTARHVAQSDIKTLSDQDLVDVGLKRTAASETFFVQPDRERIMEAENA